MTVGRFSDDPAQDWPQVCEVCGRILCDCGCEEPEPECADDLANAEIDEARAEGDVLDAADALIAALRRLVRVPEGVRPALEALEAASAQLTQASERATRLRRAETERVLHAARAAELPFGADRPEVLAEPFCACGRVISRCDGTRKGCRR